MLRRKWDSCRQSNYRMKGLGAGNRPSAREVVAGSECGGQFDQKKANPIKNQIGQKEMGDRAGRCNRLPAGANRADVASSLCQRFHANLCLRRARKFGRVPVAQCGETFSAVERLIFKDIGV
jgi:hypothetical protein